MAKASKEVAKNLGVSRAQLIRQAIAHEIENFKSRIAQKAIVSSITAMKKSKTYLSESEEITGGLNSVLPKDEDEWWSKKQY